MLESRTKMILESLKLSYLKKFSLLFDIVTTLPNNSKYKETKERNHYE